MFKVVIIYILIIAISILVGLSIRLNNTNSSLDRGAYIEDVSLDIKCESGICPPKEEKNKE